MHKKGGIERLSIRQVIWHLNTNTSSYEVKTDRTRSLVPTSPSNQKSKLKKERKCPVRGLMGMSKILRSFAFEVHLDGIVESSPWGFNSWEWLGEEPVVEALYWRHTICAPSRCGEHPNDGPQPYRPVDRPVGLDVDVPGTRKRCALMDCRKVKIKIEKIKREWKGNEAPVPIRLDESEAVGTDAEEAWKAWWIVWLTRHVKWG